MIEGFEQTTFLLTHDFDAEAAVAAALATGATGIQPYGRLAEDAARAGADAGLMVLRPVGPGDDWRPIPPEQYPLFDARNADGTMSSGERSLPDTDRPYVVAGGLDPSNVGDLIRRHRPFGVDVSSGVESRPGAKDHQKLAAFVEAVRGAD